MDLFENLFSINEEIETSEDRLDEEIDNLLDETLGIEAPKFMLQNAIKINKDKEISIEDESNLITEGNNMEFLYEMDFRADSLFEDDDVDFSNDYEDETVVVDEDFSMFSNSFFGMNLNEGFVDSLSFSDKVMIENSVNHVENIYDEILKEDLLLEKKRTRGNFDKSTGWIKKTDIKKYMENPKVKRKFEKAKDKIKKRKGKPYTSVNDKLKDACSYFNSLGGGIFNGVEYFKVEGIVVCILNSAYGLYRKAYVPYMNMHNATSWISINILGGKGTVDDEK